MARTNAANYSSPGFAYATADADGFDRLDVAGQGQSLDGHDHSSGKGLPLAAGAIPNGTITSAMIADGTIVAADHADASITNAKLASDTARASLLVNGGFEIWSRGNGPFTANGAFTADRWHIVLNSSTLSVSKDTTNVDSSSACAAACTCAFTSSGPVLVQKLEDLAQLRGRTVTFSMRVRTATANAVRLIIGDSVTATNSTFHPGGGTYQTLTVTQALSASATTIQMNVSFEASCTAYLDNAMLVVGSVPADYAPLHPADDLARCQRYYEVVGDVQFYPFVSGWQASAAAFAHSLSFHAWKAVTPTITKNGTWTVTNCGQPTIIGAALHGFGVTTTVTATGYAATYPGAVGQNCTVEANP